jgi:hypothetical protein
MFKFLLIIILVVYSLFRIGTFILKVFFGSLGKQQYSQQRTSSRRAPGSNLNIDHVQQQPSKKSQNFSGGEYVDYEEVK